MEPLSAAALLFCSTTQPGPYPPAPVVIDAFVEAYNLRDAKAFAGLIASDAVIVRGDLHLRGDQWVANYRDFVFAPKPRLRMIVKTRLAQDDMVAQSEVYSSEGLPDQTMLAVYRVEHGCIVGMSASSPVE